MRVCLLQAPWYTASPTDALLEACASLSVVWREAAIGYYSDRSAKITNLSRSPTGMQGQLNRTIQMKMLDSGWSGGNGRFFKDGTWLRITFRHQMSLGSDLLDAAKVCAKEDCQQVAIFAGEAEWLNLVSPNDSKVLVSFEKLRIAVADLHGVLNIPLYIGSLKAEPNLPPEIEAELRLDRPRNFGRIKP